MRTHRIRLIASDLDGTLLRDDKTITAHTAATIRAATAAGMFVVALSEFITFTYRLPWLDVFANPPGW